MTYNPIRFNRVPGVRNRDGIESGANATPAVPTRARTGTSFKKALNRMVHESLQRNRTSRQMQRELAARDERLLMDIGLVRDHVDEDGISMTNGGRFAHGLHISGRRRRDHYRAV